MYKAARLILGGLAAAAVSACAGGTVTYGVYHGNFDPSMLNYAAGKGGIYTELVGNPFDAPGTEVAEVVTSTMFSSHFGAQVDFLTERPADSTSPYMVKMLFNPAPGVSAANLCEDSNQPSQAVPGKLRVMAAFCASGYRETSVVGAIHGTTSPDDPAFRQLIRQLTVQLFPPNNPDVNGGGLDFNT